MTFVATQITQAWALVARAPNDVIREDCKFQFHPLTSEEGREPARLSQSTTVNDLNQYGEPS